MADFEIDRVQNDGPHIAQMIDGLRFGGAEQLILTFARALQRRNVKLTVITLKRDEPQMQQELQAMGVRVKPFHSRKLVDPVRFWKLWQFMRRERFDVIHTHLTMSNILGATVGRLSGIPVVTSLHNTRTRSQSHMYHGRLEEWLLKYSVQRVVAVGWSVAEVYQERLSPKPIVVIPNAVPSPPVLSNESREDLRSSLSIGPENTLLIAVGRLEAQKAFDDLLIAFAELQETQPQTRLIIAGQGPDQTVLGDQIQELDLTGEAQLLGLRDDVPALLAASDIFVSSSHWEGLPLATLEALMAGLPVVVTAVGDVPRVVTDESGILVPPGQPKQLAAALRRVVVDDDLRRSLGQSAQRTANESFEVEAWVDKILALYGELIPASIGRFSKAYE